jgi:energy-converting hydrogenase Eha subunit E
MSTLLAGLLLKIAMTAGIVVAASIVVERSGPFIGALIASLPTAGGAAMIILAWEHPPAFIAQSAVGSMVSNVLVAVFALSYAVLAQRYTLLPSIGGAYVMWFFAAYLTRFTTFDAWSAALLNAVVFPLAIFAGSRFRVTGAVRPMRLTPSDVAWRAGVVTLCVLIVTAASYSIGSFASGLFAFFPVAMGSFFVILQPRVGGKAAASVAAHVHAPLIGLGLGLLAVHFLAVPLGVWWSYAVGLSIGIGWNALLWLARRWRATR